MDKARNPTADQRWHFPGLLSRRNSGAGGCKPLASSCVQGISAPLGRQRSAAVSPSSNKWCHFTVCSVPESLLGHIPPRMPVGTREAASLWLSSLGLWRGEQWVQPRPVALMLVHAAPSCEITIPKESLVAGDRGDAAGAVQACQWYLPKIIKLRESSLFLAYFYLLLKRVMSKCANTCLAQSLRAPAPMCSFTHGTHGSSTAKWAAKGVPLPGLCRGWRGQWVPMCVCPHAPPCSIHSLWVSTPICTLYLGLAALAREPGNPSMASGAASRRRWLLSCSIYRCLTPPGAEHGTTSHRRCGWETAAQPAPAAALGFTLTPSSLFLHDGITGGSSKRSWVWGIRGLHMTPAVFAGLCEQTRAVSACSVCCVCRECVC